jgi:acyl phosphate:glycerol-3-phosphate acyltransferase
LCLTPLALLAVLALFVAIVAWSRYISLGSVVAAGLFPLAVWLIERPELAVLLAAVFSGAFVIYRHRDNIRRLRAATEHKFSFGSRKP